MIQPILTDSTVEEPDLKFESLEAETAYWQDRAMTEVIKRFEKLTAAETQKKFDELKPEDQANVRRIRSWLPHKRIREMGNPGEDIVTLTAFPSQFDPKLALRRLLEYSDDSGAATLMKNLGITKPKQVVLFRMDFGQIAPDLQVLVWGIHQKLREGGIATLGPAERHLLQNRPGLFPVLK